MAVSFALKKILFYILIISPFVSEARNTKPADAWVKSKYELYFEDTDKIVHEFLNRRKRFGLPESVATKKSDAAVAKEFRSWVKGNKSEILFQDERLVALIYYYVDSLGGNDLVKKPAILIYQNDEWVEFNPEVIEVSVFDLDGDKKPDIYYETGCCGGRAAGALLNRGNQPPVETNTAGWTDLSPQFSKAPNTCNDSDIPPRTPFTMVGLKKGACDEFRIELGFRHCNKQRKAKIIFNCTEKSFNRAILPP